MVHWEERARSVWHSKVKPNRHNDFLVAFNEGEKEEERRAARGWIRRVLSVLWGIARTVVKWAGRVATRVSRLLKSAPKRAKRKGRTARQQRRGPKHSARHRAGAGNVRAAPSRPAGNPEVARIENLFARKGDAG